MAHIDISAHPGKSEVTVTRTISAPREAVFKTVTDPLLIPKWWGPRRLDIKVIKMVMEPSYYGIGSDTPIEMAVEVTLKDIGGKTVLMVEQCGLPEGAMLEQVREGWIQSFDKLSSCLG